MRKGTSEKPAVILTIGHSIHTLEVFIRLLCAHEVKHVVDVRTVPRSRRNPQFNRETLPDSLKAVGIRYTHMAGLGGLRHPRPDSPNIGWRNASFRGFADYMQTPEFEKNLETMIALAGCERIALMCAESLPWRCHRSLIADALLVRNIQVEHIMSEKKRQPHKLTPWAVVRGIRITYPPDAAQIDPGTGKES
ncbi:MAG: DNA repair protein [Candidatus Brocadia sp.]|jgi:Uncharacterized conserved protein|uniref:DNA repair protein n=1 Tax=Candidatus Brocadia fulgida TaxID=380242 RepID=A0A0M2UYC9_9BACT|nr:MAG: hypothetical protein BROFUL_00410 [Candidatus Brocadia fulgida]MCC6324358.1 DUF488 domain-containing protein [Candidatus Brocadia sp.]MCE7912771.1 DUF488 domain-containing protein [Candidatus Brocadia sp. AMX3]OQY99492.1 MAG: DNA repair protein [Candidatus Brocadia sp. UTAMX2]MBV6518443.1 hypothetical protein [Candidatus Brocadia fulgida]